MILFFCLTGNAQFLLQLEFKSYETNAKIDDAEVYINDSLVGKTGLNGKLSLMLPQGKYAIGVRAFTFDALEDSITLSSDFKRTFKLKRDRSFLADYTLSYNDYAYEKHRSVDDMGLFAGKKSDLIIMERVSGNKATGNPRELYKQIAGLNVWESDGGGLQLGIGGRGLSPDRSSNFNVRQNGYDISADALGYPESYYTPPAEAIHKIDVIRGAASLQYGTQFGGLVNFRLLEAPDTSSFSLKSRTTIGSNAFFNQFIHLGGAEGVHRYSAYFQYKKGNDFRPNSAFNQAQAHITYRYHLDEDSYLGFEFTKMNYLAQQPGGLTDDQFRRTPFESFRHRNWFSVDWNLANLNYRWQINKKNRFDAKVFGLLANRKSLGVLTRTDREDDGNERTLISGDFKNIGWENRWISFFGENNHVFLLGTRLYHGNNLGVQGAGPADSAANFIFLNSDSLDNEYRFPSWNAALFAETIFRIGEKLKISPGFRVEHIETNADGYYMVRFTDLAGNLIEENRIEEDRNSRRTFPLFGLGVSYNPNDTLELYMNFSQNYRAITFNDMRVVNPNFRIDPNLEDEKGFTADIGFRGFYKRAIKWDISAFYLFYNNRIGLISQVDSTLNNLYMYRTNIASSRNMGLESYVSWDMAQSFFDSANFELNLFVNVAYIDAKYIRSERPEINGNSVELAPAFTLKTGLSFRRKNLGVSWQISYTDEQFTDATNAINTPNAINGLIPSYAVQDLALNYNFKRFRLEAGINNLFNEVYFTRRASGYPGPGILPSAGRTGYLTLQILL